MALDAVVAERLPEVRDIGLDDVPRLLGRLLAPDLVDQGLGGHELVRADEQMREDRALLGPAERDRAAPRVHLERPQDAELHRPPVHPPRLPARRERSHLLRDVDALRSDRQDVDGIGKPLEMQLPAIDVADALDRASEVNDALTAQDLSRTGLPAQPRREVQGSPAEPALDLNRLACVQPDPDGEREIRSRQRLLEKPRLQLDRRPDRLTGRTEDREGFVSPQLDHRSVPSLYLLANDIGEPSREPARRFVTALLGEDAVPADVRDKERPDLLCGGGRRRASVFLADSGSVRSRRSVVRPPHAAEYRSLDPRAPGRRLVLSVAHGRKPRARRLRTAGKSRPAVVKAPPPGSPVVLMRATRRREEEMTGTDRTGSRAGCSSTARRRPAVASLLLAFALMAGACGGATQEASDATAGADPDGAEQTLSIVDVGSGTETAFTAPEGASEFDVTLDGSMVAYSDRDENGNAQVFVMHADGSNARQLTHGEGGAIGGPAWSPDGFDDRVPTGYVRRSQIFVVRVSNGESTKVTNEPRGAVDPGGWTPDGGSIVFSTVDAAVDHYSALSLDLSTGNTRLIVPDGSTPNAVARRCLDRLQLVVEASTVRLILANSDGSATAHHRSIRRRRRLPEMVA